MIGYICKYTPIEIFEAFGKEVKKIEPDVANFNQADTLLHPNLCSFAKGIVETILEQGQDYEAIILTTCCDSIRRVYDVLKEKLLNTFVYILDVPRIAGHAGCSLYEKRIREMLQKYEEFSGEVFDEKILEKILKQKIQEKEERKEHINQDLHNMKRDKNIKIGILGARANPAIYKILENRPVTILFDLTCTGFGRRLSLEKDVFPSYIRGLLGQFPCMRMKAASNRDQMIQKYADLADGIIYHTVQFCDNYSYEYAWLKETLKKPMLLLETDYSKQSYGQILTRMEAFLESLSLSHVAAVNRNRKIEKKTYAKKTEGDKMYVLGIDSGSTSTNAVIFNENQEMKAFSVVRTGAKAGESAERVVKEVLEKAKLKREQISYIVSTGYGRVSIPFADETVTEISCHGKGAHYFNPNVRTILDIGGQDSKVIKLDSEGEVIDFVMNDKCAAGTGRFLEAIARTLEVEIEELGEIALKSKEEIVITSMCTVFAESEVISLIANNKEKADIANGICHAIASKAFSMIRRVGLEPEVMMTGGVAQNLGVVHAVEEKIQNKLYICKEPEIVGAVGAAMYAISKLR